MAERTFIKTVWDAEEAIRLASYELGKSDIKPTRMLISLAFFTLIQQSQNYIPSAFGLSNHRAYAYDPNDGRALLEITITSTNPTAAFVTLYSE